MVLSHSNTTYKYIWIWKKILDVNDLKYFSFRGSLNVRNRYDYRFHISFLTKQNTECEYPHRMKFRFTEKQKKITLSECLVWSLRTIRIICHDENYSKNMMGFLVGGDTTKKDLLDRKFPYFFLSPTKN